MVHIATDRTGFRGRLKHAYTQDLLTFDRSEVFEND
jgi:hypothetical protein